MHRTDLSSHTAGWDPAFWPGLAASRLVVGEAPTAGDLRRLACGKRVEFLRLRHPGSLPRVRAEPKCDTPLPCCANESGIGESSCPGDRPGFKGKGGSP